MHLADGLLSLAAYALATIATLRAGSRVSYLITHDEIGVMEGPLILPPRSNNTLTNGTNLDPNPLYELADAFRLSVFLALAPQFYVTDGQESEKAPTVAANEEDSKKKGVTANTSSDIDVNVTTPHVASGIDLNVTTPHDDVDENVTALEYSAPENVTDTTNTTLSDTIDSENVPASDNIADENVTLLANHTNENVTSAALTVRSNKLGFQIGSAIPALLKRSLLDNQKRIERLTMRVKDAVLPELWSLGVRTSESISVHFALASTTSSEAYSQSAIAATKKRKLWPSRRKNTGAAGPSIGQRSQKQQPQQLQKQQRQPPLWIRVFSRLKPPLPTFSSSKRQVLQAYNSLKSMKPYRWLKKTTKYWIGAGQEESVDEVISDTWEEDFNFSTTITAQVGVDSTNSTTRPVEITAYAPEGFANLRSRFGISETGFANSILRSGPYVSFQSNSKGAARTGGIFFFTRDGAYMIKTIRPSEAKTLLKMLPKYYNHMKKYAKRSLLTRFFGMYKVRLKQHLGEDEKEFIIVIMNSVFPAEASKFICERFDLKGSTVGRECSVEERQTKGRNAILKDLDLAKEVELVRSFQKYPEGYGLHVGPKAKAMLLSQLRRDVSLLVDCKVMDYSLLVGIVNLDLDKVDESTLRALDVSRQEEVKMKRARSKRRVDHQMLLVLSAPIRIMMAPPWYFARQIYSMAERTVSSILTLPLPYYGAGKCVVDGGALSVVQGTRNGNRAIYYLGVIDFLQPWTARKVLERQIKGMMGYDTTAISCVDPKEYAARFLEFLEAHVS